MFISMPLRSFKIIAYAIPMASACASAYASVCMSGALGLIGSKVK